MRSMSSQSYLKEVVSRSIEVGHEALDGVEAVRPSDVRTSAIREDARKASITSLLLGWAGQLARTNSGDAPVSPAP